MNRYEWSKGDRCYVYGQVDLHPGTVVIATPATVLIPGWDKVYVRLDEWTNTNRRNLYVPANMVSPLTMDAEFFIKEYNRFWHKAISEVQTDDTAEIFQAAQEMFDMIAPASGIVGYFLSHYEQNAGKEFSERLEAKKAAGAEPTESEKWIQKVLIALSEDSSFHEKKNSIPDPSKNPGKTPHADKKQAYILRSKIVSNDQYAVLCDKKGKIIRFDSFEKAYDAMCNLYLNSINATGKAIMWQVYSEEA